MQTALRRGWGGRQKLPRRPQCWVQRVWPENLCDGGGATKGIKEMRVRQDWSPWPGTGHWVNRDPRPIAFLEVTKHYPILTEPRAGQESGWPGMYLLALPWTLCTPPPPPPAHSGTWKFGTLLELRAWPQAQMYTAARSCQPRIKSGKEGGSYMGEDNWASPGSS